MKKPVRKAIFPVGGLGTRFLPATKAMPKEMLPVFDKPLIQYAFEEAKAAGIQEFIFVTGRNKNAISDHFDHAYELQHVLEKNGKTEALSAIRDWMPEPGQIAFIRQQEPLGLGHAVYCAHNLVNSEPFAVLLADEMLLSDPPFLKQMIDVYNECGGNVVGVTDVPKDKVQNYGIVKAASDDGSLIKISGMIEKPSPAQAPSATAMIGRYILHSDIFTYLEKIKPGRGGEIQLTDAMIESLKTSDFFGLRFQGKRFDCGSRVGLLEATVASALQDKEASPEVRAILKQYAR